MPASRFKSGRLASVAKHVNILLVEDDPADVALTRRALEKSGLDHDIYIATNGRDVSQFAETAGRRGHHPWPDLIILDVHLPGTNGYEVLQNLRQHPECAFTPVIATSGISSDPEIARLEELPLVGFFHKGTDLEGYMRLGPLVVDVLG